MLGERERQLKSFARKVKIPQKNLELLDLALTHKSYANEKRAHAGSYADFEKHNQRLEFLGDSILGLVIADYLYEKYPRLSEGYLTRRKAQLVCAPTLAQIAEKLELGKYLKRGKGESQAKQTTSVLADALEAVIGAIYLMGGLRAVRKFVLYHWEPYLKEEITVEESIDYKSWLQVYLAKHKRLQPEYRLVSTAGPEHAKMFTVELFVGGKKETTGTAGTRKKADQLAAKAYIEKYKLKGPQEN